MNRISCVLLGQTLVRRTAMEVLNIPFEEMVVVTGYDADLVCSQVNDLPLKVSFNKEYETGVHSSIRHGVSQFKKYQDGFFVCFSDQPELDSDLLRQMIRVFQSHSAKKIIYPVIKGKRSQPILIPREFIPEILQHEDGDYDCSYLLKKYPQRIEGVEIVRNIQVRDIDRREELSNSCF